MTPLRTPPVPRFRSPLRGPWLTSVFAVVLLVGMPLVIITGLLDYIAYGQGQAIPGDVGLLRLPGFDWPSRPSWLFRLTQGLHVGLGLILVPVVLAKLWSVIPRLFALPPVKSIAHALERGTLLLLVGGILFEIATGLLNIQYDYVFGFSFYAGHYYGAWVFIGAFVAHVILKLPHMLRGLGSRSLRTELRTPLAQTLPEEITEESEGLVSDDPAPATMSRRGALALVGGGVAFVGAITAGQTIGGPFREWALLLPRSRVIGEGGNRFPINRTAVAAGITTTNTGADWRLALAGPTPRTFTRDELLGMAQHTAVLPISCVEGWSSVQTWTGVRVRDLAALAGVPEPASAVFASVEQGGFSHSVINWGQAANPDSLVALRVNGEDLSLDHGYPARLIVPAMPAVKCTKWVNSIEFRSV